MLDDREDTEESIRVQSEKSGVRKMLEALAEKMRKIAGK